MLRIFRQTPERFSGGGADHDGTAISFTTTDPELLEAADPQELLGSRYPVHISYGERAVFL